MNEFTDHQEVQNYLTDMIAKDMIIYFKNNKIKRLHTHQTVINNPNVKSIANKKIVGMDIESAFWNKAFELGIISDLTYLNGLMVPELYSNLGIFGISYLVPDTFSTYLEGTFIKINANCKEIIQLLIYECLKDMRRLSKLLKNDYVRYTPDSIYFVASKKNMEIVKEFMKKNDLNFKSETSFVM